jgi:endonuclease YncB( thermonuclease family)
MTHLHHPRLFLTVRGLTWLCAALQLVWIVSSCSGLAAAADPPVDPIAPTSALVCQVVNVHDADTVSAIIRCPLLKVDSQLVVIRAFGYDAWEVSRVRQTVDVTDSEIFKGKAARDQLKALLAEATLYAEDSGSVDPYGRTSAVLWVRQGTTWIYLAAYAEQHGWLRTPRAAKPKASDQ